MSVRLGIATFGDNTLDSEGNPVSPAETIRNVLKEGQLAEQVGLDAFGVGEHHREDYAISAPDTILAGLATSTERITLETAVTVLSSEDPVRLFQRFSTIQAMSNGRAQIVAGRGSFVESFPLFGYQLKDYEVLYEEKLDMLHKLLQGGPITWSGTTRTGLREEVIHPQLEEKLPLRVAVGGTPTSVLRAAVYGLPVSFAIIGGPPARFRQLGELYRQALENQHPEASVDTSVHSMGFIAESDEEAQRAFWPHYKKFHDKLGAERGWGELSETAYRGEIEKGSLYVGSPETVASKISNTLETVGAHEFSLKYATGTMSHEQLMESIRLFGEEVAPRVRAARA